jgi:flagellar M-ring protein FliF
MPESLRQLFANLAALSAGRMAALALAAAGSLAFFGWLIASAGAPSHQALFRGLEAEEAARVVDGLAQEKIPYRLEDGGTTVLVPAMQVQEARIRMAGRGLPSGASAGFELFDQNAFGVTDFVQRVNFQRALQGELARTIEHLDPVERAHVQLAIPERKGVIADSQREPRASVIVRLKPGRDLARGQVDAIVHLVASSVEGLDRGDVAVVDGTGRLLAPRDGESDDLATSDGTTNHQGRVEGELAKRIEAMLEKTVGAGGVVARVRAELDWTESSVTEEVFDPEVQVARSEQRSEELSTEGGSAASVDGTAGAGAGGVGGVPGAVANDPAAAGAVAAAPDSMSSRKTETINYEISKKVVRSNTPRGQVKKLSIAVLVADPTAPPLADGAPAPAPAPWNADQLKRFEDLARQAVGFDEKRGDKITVTSAPFRGVDATVFEDSPIAMNWLPLAESLLRGALVLVALLVFARLIVKPAVGALASAQSAIGGGAFSAGPAPSVGAALGAGAAAASTGASSGGAASAEALGEPAARVALAPPAEGVKALRAWLAQG